MNIIAIAEKAKEETGIPRVHCLAVVRVVLASLASKFAAKKDIKLFGVGSFTFQQEPNGCSKVIFQPVKQLSSEERAKKDARNAKIRAANNAKRELEWATKTWYSAITDPVDVNGYLAVPLLNRQELKDSLIDDHQRIQWYGYKCHKGVKQVYNFIGAEKHLVATVILTEECGLWELDCVYSIDQGQNKSVHNAAILLVQKYNAVVPADTIAYAMFETIPMEEEQQKLEDLC